MCLFSGDDVFLFMETERACSPMAVDEPKLEQIGGLVGQLLWPHEPETLK